MNVFLSSRGYIKQLLHDPAFNIIDNDDFVVLILLLLL